MIETFKSGAYICDGVAELGQVIYTKVYRYNEEFLFQPRYELPQEKTFGGISIPSEALDTGMIVYNNDIVRIAHPNLAYCYKAVRHYEENGEKLIDVVATFPSGIFLGYWAYFEPSNNRPVVQMHDSAEFFLLEANKKPAEMKFTLAIKEKKAKMILFNKQPKVYVQKYGWLVLKIAEQLSCDVRYGRTCQRLGVAALATQDSAGHHS